jgi:hypothetical protein
LYTNRNQLTIANFYNMLSIKWLTHTNYIKKLLRLKSAEIYFHNVLQICKFRIIFYHISFIYNYLINIIKRSEKNNSRSFFYLNSSQSHGSGWVWVESSLFHFIFIRLEPDLITFGSKKSWLIPDLTRIK